MRTAAFSSDWEVVDPHTIRPRATCNHDGAGRLYSVAVTRTDSGGAVSTKAACVSVPIEL